MTTEQLIALDRAHVWHPFTPMKAWVEKSDPIVIERGAGVMLYDSQGRGYIDGVSSLWCNVHGHCVPELDAAVVAQLGKVAHSTLLGLSNVPSILLAKELVEIAPRGLTKVFYSDDGSTAVEVACKMAFQFWKNQGTPRQRFIALDNSYHGDTVGAVSLGGIPLFHAAFKGLTFAVDFAPPPQRRKTSASNDSAEPTITQWLAPLEQLLAAHPGEYAAIVIEPAILGAGGILMQPHGTLTAFRELADRYNTLLIFDEVMTGFGRTGKMFASDLENVTPDLLCLSKGLTAGYMPLGVTMTTDRIYAAFYADPRAGKTFFHGHTFTGHPLACAVALASLDLFRSRNLLDHVQRMGAVLAEELRPAIGKPHVADVRSLGLVGAIELVQDVPTCTPFDYHWRIGGALCNRMRTSGVLLRPLGDTLVIMPPLAIDESTLRQLCRVVVQSLDAIPEIVREITASPRS
jgi:adenosylmethionine-8-amino-7-oxononanoate transaminase